MKRFTYAGKNKNGQDISGTCWADNVEEVRMRLSNNGLYILNIEEMQASYWKRVISPSNAWAKRDVIHFAFQLGLLLEAGLPLRKIMQLQLGSYQQGRRRRTKLVTHIEEICAGVERGERLHQLLATTGFPKLACTLTEAGEVSGNVGTVMLHIAAYYEKDKAQREKLIQLMIYPAFIALLMVAFFLVTIWFILPAFKSVFESMGTELPYITKILFRVGDAVTKHGLLIILVLLLASLGGISVWKYEATRIKIDTLLWQLLAKYSWYGGVQYARIFRVTGMLLESGIPLIKALDTVSPLWSNQYARQQGKGVITLLQEGQGLSEAWRHQSLGRPLIYELLAAGEVSGELDAMLLQCANYYDAEVARGIGKLQQSIEPVLMSIMGVSVGGLVIAIMMPLLESVNSIGNM